MSDPQAGSPGAQKTASEKPLIIHHLSDLHHQQDPSPRDERQHDTVLLGYFRYIQKLKEDELPDLVIFTGDLTDTGMYQDFHHIATELRLLFLSRWEGEFEKHIFLVPGPNDLGWNGDKPSFSDFQRAFAGFGLPIISQPIQKNPFWNNKWFASSPQPATPAQPSSLFVDPKDRYAVYLLNTCVSLQLLLSDLPSSKTIKALPDEYKKALKAYLSSYNGLKNSDQQRYLPPTEQRKRFLALLEETLISLDTGAIEQEEIQRFERDMSHLAPESAPLRIIISHHPLIVHQDNLAFKQAGFGPYDDLVKAAQKHKVQLGLHGHLHKPQMLTDLALQGSGDMPYAVADQKDDATRQPGTVLVPLRQLGAGSLGTDHTFNQIIATREGDKVHWQLKVNTIAISPKPAHAPRAVFSLAILDPTEEQAREKLVREEKSRVKTREKFDEEVHAIMSRYFEAIHKEGTDDVLTRPFDDIERVIHSVIFEGFNVETGLVLKCAERVPHPEGHEGWRPTSSLDPIRDVTYELRHFYIFPDKGEIPVFDYPATVAAWALILGRELIYPESLPAPLTPEKRANMPAKDVQQIEQELKRVEDDRKWLEVSRKGHHITELLKFRIEQLEQQIKAGNLEPDEVSSRRKHQERLQKMLDGRQNQSLTMNEIYLPMKGQHPFLSMPIPLRPSGFSADQAEGAPVFTEVGVLNVTMFPYGDEAIDAARSGVRPAADASAFTPDRLAMLRALSDLMYLMLIDAARMGRCKTPWII